MKTRSGAILLGCAVLATGVAAQTTPPTPSLVLPAPDSSLQARLNQVLSQPPYRSLVRQKKLSVALVDLTNPGQLRYASVDDNHMRYAASLPKIAIMLGVFDQVDKGNLEYTPELRRRLERMIRRSNNRESTRLIELVGFDAIAAALEDPRFELYDDDRNGGLWVGRDYGGGPGLWRRDPINTISHGATARQVIRFLVMMERERLVSPWASREMKAIMGQPATRHKFVLGLRNRAGSRIFRKSGTWRTFHSDAAIVERNGRKYAAVALLETEATGILARLIVQLDDLIHNPRATRAR